MVPRPCKIGLMTGRGKITLAILKKKMQAGGMAAFPAGRWSEDAEPLLSHLPDRSPPLGDDGPGRQLYLDHNRLPGHDS
jgi:hypothetical protein